MGDPPTRGRLVIAAKHAMATARMITTPVVEHGPRRRDGLRAGVAALADRYGVPQAGQVLAAIDQYYTDQRGPGAEGVATQLARQLAAPRPADQRTIRQLGSYKGLDARWADWENVTGVCRSLAVEMTR